MSVDTKWLADQADDFSKRRGAFVVYGEILEIVLQHLADHVCKTALVTARAKELASFAKKCVKYSDELKGKVAVDELTDLCGGRIVVPIRSQVDQLNRMVVKNFDIVQSQDTFERLKSDQFGYRSVHHIVRVRPSALMDLGLVSKTDKKKISPAQLQKVKDLRAEIQIRTIAQHAWAEFGHDVLYKSTFTPPSVWQRASARIAAQVEVIDDSFLQIEHGMQLLETNAGSFMPRAQAEAEILKLQAILRYDRKNLLLANQITRLQVSIGKYEDAVQQINTIEKSGVAPDLDLTCTHGYALCRKNRDDRNSDEYRRGQELLQKVVEESRHTHVEAMTRYADALDPDKLDDRRKLFRNAYDVAPSDPMALCGYLVNEIAQTSSTELLEPMRPNIDSAIEKCQNQIAVRVNLPYALYQLGVLNLLRHEPMQALYAVCRALSCTHEPRLREDSLRRFLKLQVVRKDLKGVNWCLDVLRLANSTPDRLHLDLQRRIKVPASQWRRPRPVVIVAGGCDPHEQQRLEEFTRLLQSGFRGFEGSIIYGGTHQGISGIAAKLVDNKKIFGISYGPPEMPTDKSATRADKKTIIVEPDEFHHDPNRPFTPALPIQNWIDLLGAGFAPNEVKLVGVDGGSIAAFEYHLAAALGGEVAIIEQSGREANRLFLNASAAGNEGLTFLPNDEWILNAFVRLNANKDPEVPYKSKLNTLADGAHDAYVEVSKKLTEEDLKAKRDKDPSLARAYADSNLQQVLDIDAKLHAIRLRVVRKDAPGRAIKVLSEKDHVPLLAQMEHGRWVIERLRRHWKLGTRDDSLRQRPSLVAWEKLKHDDVEKDLNAVRVIPELLRKAGFKIVAM